MSHGPRPCGKGWVRIPDALRQRVRAVAARLGTRHAQEQLRVSGATLEELQVEYGRTQPNVIERVSARLDEIDAKDPKNTDKHMEEIGAA